MYKNISTFKGLNALRFIAAYLVVLHHSETIKRKNNLVNFEWLGLFRNGPNAVSFFFVLSGFLITYLLLKESSKTGKINVGHFYLKRVLRIWPLYFLLVFIGVFALPFLFKILGVHYEMPYTFSQTWFYFVFFVPGLVLVHFGHHFLEPLWSIGVEEYFYLMWAPLFKLFHKRLLLLLLSVIAFKAVLILLSHFYFTNETLNYLIETFQFEAMAVGGLGAYFLFKTDKKLSELFIFKKYNQLLFLSLCVTFLTFHSNLSNPLWNTVFQTPVVSGLFISFLFLYVILCVSVAENSIVKINSKILDYLGDISYGIYMYHMLFIFAAIQFFKGYINQLNVFWGQLLFYGIVTFGVIVVASLSKKLFEDFFLKLKPKTAFPQRSDTH